MRDLCPFAAPHASSWNPCISITFHRLTSSPHQTEDWSFNNTLHRLDPDWISGQKTMAVDRTLRSDANRLQLFVCARSRPKDPAAVDVAHVRSGHGPWDPACLRAAVLCWAHHCWPGDPHLHGNRDTHTHTQICIHLCENPLNLSD